MKQLTSLAFFFYVLVFTVSAQTTDNAELARLHNEDQAARQTNNIDWKVVNIQDSARRARVYELIAAGKVQTAKDHYHSAMIFQHGMDKASSAMAVKQMRKAIELDSTMNKWLLAAAIDRQLMNNNEPQIYGTQYVKRHPDTKWSRYKIDSTKITDEERIRFNVETLAQQREKERTMNLLNISDYHAGAGAIDRTLELIGEQNKLGTTATYNITESAINMFGYDLMAQGKDHDALKVFELNTKLYPTGFNTFDSYGEILMKLNRRTEALGAYRRSLQLNPANDNAAKILAADK